MKAAQGAIAIATVASIAMLAACSDDKKSKIDPEADPDLLSSALEKVQFAGQDAERKDGDLPLASNDAAAPSILLGDKLFSASKGERVTFPFSVNSDSPLSALFAKVEGAPDFFQVSLSGSTKVMDDYSLGFGLPNNLLDGTACFDLAAQDDAGLVGRSTDLVCVEVVTPTATPTPTAAPTAAPTPTTAPTTAPTGSPTGAPTPTPTGGVAPTPTPAPTTAPTNPPTTGSGSAAACFNADLFAQGTRVVQTFKSTNSDGTVDFTDDRTIGGNTTFDGRTAQKTTGTTTSTDSASGQTVTTSTTTYTQTDTSVPKVTTIGVETESSAQGFTSSTVIRNNPGSVMPYNLNAGQSASNSYTQTLDSTTAGFTLSTTAQVTETHTYIGRATTSVPAGTFATCVFNEASEFTSQGQTTSSTTRNEFDVNTGLLVRQVSGDTISELQSATINGSPIR